MTTVVLDLERLRYLACGLGQFSLHLGRSVLAASDESFSPILLLPAACHHHFAGQPLRQMDSAVWRRDGLIRWLRPLAGCWPRRSPIDVWHVTHQDSKFWPLDPRIPVVLTIHDLNFLREKPPHVIRRRLRRLRYNVSRAAVITTGSEHAAQEIREYLMPRGKPIRIVPHGICLDSSQTPVRPAAVPEGRPFLFTIGDIAPKKNFHVLLDLLERETAYRLVIAGSKTSDYAASIERGLRERGLHDRVVLPGCVSEGERNWLYANCAAFVFPSLTEGFGLPLIEAMSFGRPVFAARRTSLPEVGGPWAFYWDTFDGDALSQVFRAGLQTYGADPQYADKLRAWASQFSWPLATQRYIALYRETAQPAQVQSAAA